MVLDPDWLRHKRRKSRSYLGTTSGAVLGSVPGTALMQLSAKRYNNLDTKLGHLTQAEMRFPTPEVQKMMNASKRARLGSLAGLALAPVGLIGGAIAGNRLGRKLRNKNKKGYEPTKWG